MVCDSRLYVIKEARRDTVVLGANGITKEVEWGRLQPANNWTGVVGRGEYVWVAVPDQDGYMTGLYVLHCVAFNRGDTAKVYSTLTGEPVEKPIRELFRMGPRAGLQGNQAFGRFATACSEDNATQAKKLRPSQMSGLASMCQQFSPDRLQTFGAGNLTAQDGGRLSQGNPTESYWAGYTSEHARNAESLENLRRQEGGLVMDWEPGEPEPTDLTPTGSYKTTYLIGAAVGAAVVVYVLTR